MNELYAIFVQLNKKVQTKNNKLHKQTINLYLQTFGQLSNSLPHHKMTFRLIILFIFALFLDIVHSINPYHVLQLEEGATQDHIRNQYKLLRKSAKDNKIKQQLYDDAYQQIMIDSTLQMTLPKEETKVPKQNRRNRRRRRGMPRLSDMFRSDYLAPKQSQPKKTASQRAFQAQDQKNYAQQLKLQNQHGYKLPPQYDDSQFSQTEKKVEQTIKDQNVEFNIKAARYILFLGGILLKLTPCICLYLIYKYRKQAPREQQEENNPFVKAMNGWTGRNRRQVKKMK